MRRYLFVLLLSLAIVQCSGPREPEYTGPVFGPGPRHVIVISLDCLRADHLSCYGYDKTTSPNLDALCGESIRFSRATAPHNWTLPSHTSLFTGLYARGHGVRKGNQAITAEIPTLVEPLQAAGIATAAFTGGAFMASRYGHDRGFDDFWSSSEDFYQWEEILEFGEDWLESNADRDAFLFLHTYEIHMPYYSPDKYLDEMVGYHHTEFEGSLNQVHMYLTGARPRIESEIVGRYDAGILFTDDLLGQFIERLDASTRADNTLLIISSDHGEAFWEQGRWGHNGDLLGPQLSDVPLIARLPRSVFPDSVGKIVDADVSFLDIMPTVLDALGVEPTSDIDGFSLLPEMIGRPVSVADQEARERRTVKVDGNEALVGLCESINYVSLRAGDWSVVVPGPAFTSQPGAESETASYQVGIDVSRWPALYDLAADPGELDPLPLDGAIADVLGAAAARLAGRPGEADVSSQEINIPPRLKRRLEALGYL